MTFKRFQMKIKTNAISQLQFYVVIDYDNKSTSGG